jgi:hypothetical protein
VLRGHPETLAKHVRNKALFRAFGRLFKFMDTKTHAITVEMAFSKSTKGTHVYAALDAGAAAVTTVYVQKTALGNNPPPKITLTIAAAPEGA